MALYTTSPIYQCEHSCDALLYLQKLSDELSSEKCEGFLDAVQCDLRSETDIKDMFSMIQSKYGGMDVCVNNAGLLQKAPLLSGSTDAWREMLEVV